MNYAEVMKKLESLASHDPKDLAGMARFGINVDKAWVISIPKLRKLAKEIKQEIKLSILRMQESIDPRDKHEDDKWKEESHTLALQIWDSGIHEARILAGFIDDPGLVTEGQMERWVLDFDSWDVTDMICGNLFDRTSLAVQKAIEWSGREEEFVKRAGFVLMAGLAVHDKAMSDKQFVEFLGIIKRGSGDNRNFVRKAVNWALRAIGKSRNKYLYEKAVQTAGEIFRDAQDDNGESIRNSELKIRNSARRFIAGDALRELEKDYIKKRFI